MSKRYIGIDLGTTNSTVSVANLTVRGDIEAQALEVAQVDESGNAIVTDQSLPSVLYVDDQGHPYVGRFAKRINGVYPQRVIKEAKRFIGQDVSWEIDGEIIRPEMVSSYVLKILKAQAEEYYAGEKIDSVVITIPANFNFQQQQATKAAGVLSGFDKNNIHMIPEPTAALIDFLNEEKKLDPSVRRLKLDGGKKNLMVFDLGGGTCDVSILQVGETENGGIDIQELSISQYTELGGIDFDRKVVNELMKKVLKHVGMNFNQLKSKYDKKDILRLWENLLDFAEKAKKFFSTRIENQLRTSQSDYYENKEQFNSLTYREMLSVQLPTDLVTTLTITKKEYDDVIEELLYKEKSKKGNNIEEPILNALEHAKIGNMTVNDIDAVFLVGGMTYYHTIQERIYEIFGRRIKPIKSINPMFAVSRGAAVYHHQIDRINFKSSDQISVADTDISSKDVVFTNTIPNNVYIDVIGADPVALLEKGTKLPFERIIEDRFIVTGPNSAKTVNAMQLELFTATSAKSIHTKKLKSATVNFKKPVPVNSKLVLKVQCNQEREVSIKAWLESDETEVIDVNIGSHEFTEEEIENLKAKQANINKIK
ncbi:Hsp70 family protein [Bacillus sp. S/N-304-OC-R1]|uniref:Hsp70 family protein n=1 Tax=Bacillus sp. S/N-304-OC-R1 TaxID=2758034 RepID=UPI001C8F0560|nr:Hsp70 family protein [Bacillus sp. S/N-304-OC-R1]MBY0124398.1 Hsp70 family protein [Bacillus sp. S/N-304-OC-R1]